MSWEEIATLLGMLGAIVGVLLLAYFSTRYLAGRGIGGLSRIKGRGGQLCLLDRMPLGREQYLAVVRAGSSCLLIGVTGSQITLLRELSEEDAALWKPEDPGDGAAAAPMAFQDALREVWKQKKK